MKNLIWTFLLASCLAFAAEAKVFSVYEATCGNAPQNEFVELGHLSFSWKIFADERGFRQSGYEIRLAESEDNLQNSDACVWTSIVPQSSESLCIPYEGESLKSGRSYWWTVRIQDNDGEWSPWSHPQSFFAVSSPSFDWKGAKWIALEEDNPGWRVVPGCHGDWEAKEKLGEKRKEIGKYRLPVFRKTIKTEKEVKGAKAYVAGLGNFELFVNGEKAGNNFLDPGWTKYDRHAQFVAFDLSNNPAFRSVGNDIDLEVMLGNGFYNVPAERYFKVLTSFGAPKLKMLLLLEYSDGTEEDVVSDENWSVAESGISYSSIYGGEDFAAGKTPEWQQPVVTRYDGTLSLQTATPLTCRTELPVQKVMLNSKGHKVYDFGQNFSGIVRVKVKSKEAKPIILRPGELLNPDTTVNQSASGEPYYFTFTPAGSGEWESWQPQFSYYGFRYVEVECSDSADLPQLELIGVHTCNSAPEVGSFSCSQPLFNDIHELIDWAIRSNMASVFTDCPHREKLGWLEEAHLMQYSLLYRYDLSRLYRKIMADMKSSQRDDGCIPSICPEYVRFSAGFEDSPEWGSSFIICPWEIYRWYGDMSLLREYYDDMKKYLAYLDSKADDAGIVAYGLGDWFDIGPEAPGYSQLTDMGVTATAMYFLDCTIMEQVARLLEKHDDEQMFAHKAAKIKRAFIDRYLDRESRCLDRDSQAALAIALHFRLVDDEFRTPLTERLVEDIRNRGNALTAGDIGYRYVLRALEEGGRSDVIYDMNSRYDVPGYGWQLAHGATALTESWQAYGFVSNNHFMLGHLMEWLYSGLAGIGQTDDSVAFSKILIRPQFVGDIRNAGASFDSPRGRIESRWKKGLDGSITLNVFIPANADARIVLPASDVSKVLSFGNPVSICSDVKILKSEKDDLELAVGSGMWQFQILP